MYEYDEDEEGGRSRGRMIATVLAVVALALVGWFVVKPRIGDGGNAGGGSVSPGDATSTTAAAGDGSVAPSGSSVDAPSTTESGATSDPTLKADKPATSDATSTTARESTTAPTTAAPTTAGNAPYETLPNGEPAWVIATYDADSITLDGVVPDQAAKDALQNLAAANARDDTQRATIVNNLTLNPAVPRNVGVRVVELTSTRFPEGSAEVLPAHAAELDRVVRVMNALPNITALIIGHADQRGGELSNYALSEERALAVKNYIASGGIALDRLSSRAVGENDLLTLDDDEAALALNRRTEFVLYGLLLL